MDGKYILNDSMTGEINSTTLILKGSELYHFRAIPVEKEYCNLQVEFTVRNNFLFGTKKQRIFCNSLFHRVICGDTSTKDFNYFDNHECHGYIFRIINTCRVRFIHTEFVCYTLND